MSEQIIEHEENGCETCGKKKEACVSFLSHENAMMHKDMDNERMHRNNLFTCVTVIAITLIFVIGYTIREKNWLDTLTRVGVTEVADGVHQQPDS